MSRLALFPVIAAWLGLGLVAPPQPPADPDSGWNTLEEYWYAVEIAGSHAGWMHIAEQTNGQQFRTRTEQQMTIGRGAVEVEVMVRSAVVETLDHQPVSISLFQKMGQQPIETTWTFTGDGVKEIERQGEVRKESIKPRPPGEWFTPRAAHAYWLEQREADAKEIRYRLIDGANGLSPMEVTSHLQGEAVFKSDRGDVPVTVWKSTTNIMPGVEATEWYSEKAVPLFVEVAMPFGTMVTRATSKERAQRRGEVVLAPDLLTSTFVRPDKPIEDARRTTTATLRLRLRDGRMPALPQAGAQRVEPGDDERSAVVHVDIEQNLPAPAAEIGEAEYLASTVLVDAEDELVRKLAERAIRGISDDPMQQGLALRAYVHNRITRKGMETAFASASETARTQTGDCSEHAVLLCAMLRARKIPARVACGLVYADAFAGHEDIFGWHMWTQAMIDGRWIDFDATLGNRYNAAHILTGTTSLGGEELATEMAAMVLLMGNLEIDVVDVQYD